MPRPGAMGPAAAAAMRRPAALALPRGAVARPLAVRYYASSKESGGRMQRSVVRKLQSSMAGGKGKEERVADGFKAATEAYTNGNGPLVPTTFVSLPLSRYPRQPRDFLRYTWYRLRAWTTETISVVRMKMQSMPGWARPQWKAQRGRIPPTAKAMYQEMLEAFAAGDKAAVQRLCQPVFAATLVAAIDRRSPRERTRFDLVRFNKPLFYPRLASFMISQAPGGDDQLVEQAIVSIASTQKMHKVEAATGRMIDGSLRLQDKVEHVVLTRGLNGNSFQKGQWRIWGTVSATTLEAHLEENEKYRQMLAKHLGMSK